MQELRAARRFQPQPTARDNCGSDPAERSAAADLRELPLGFEPVVLVAAVLAAPLEEQRVGPAGDNFRMSRGNGSVGPVKACNAGAAKDARRARRG